MSRGPKVQSCYLLYPVSVLLVLKSRFLKIILGVVDEFANLFVYRIEEHSSDKSLKTDLVLQIDSEGEMPSELKHLRLIW